MAAVALQFAKQGSSYLSIWQHFGKELSMMDKQRSDPNLIPRYVFFGG